MILFPANLVNHGLKEVFQLGYREKNGEAEKKASEGKTGEKRPLSTTARCPPSNTLNTRCQTNNCRGWGLTTKGDLGTPNTPFQHLAWGWPGSCYQSERRDPSTKVLRNAHRRTAFRRKGCRAEHTCHQPALLPHGILCLSYTCIGHSLY